MKLIDSKENDISLVASKTEGHYNEQYHCYIFFGAIMELVIVFNYW